MQRTICPAISVVMTVGTNRENAQGVLDALSLQGCSDDLLEIVVFDCADAFVPALKMPARFAAKYLRRQGLHYWRVARAQAASESTAPVVAFLEDHCEPHSTWAERLHQAHSGGRWAAVGYAFTNGSRDSLWSRSALMADYGFFAHPVVGGPARLLAGNNVSYSRWFLEEPGDDFENSVAERGNTNRRSFEPVLRSGSWLSFDPEGAPVPALGHAQFLRAFRQLGDPGGGGRHDTARPPGRMRTSSSTGATHSLPWKKGLATERVV